MFYKRWQHAMKECASLQEEQKMNPNEIASRVHRMKEEWSNLKNRVSSTKYASSNL
jgi:hypothetical protein